MKTRSPFMLIPLGYIAAMLIFSGCAKSPFQPLPEAEVNQKHKANAERIAYRLMSGWRNDLFDPLSDDFTQQMKDGLPPRAQRTAYQSIKATFGDFQSLKFAEAVASKNMPEMVIYRFRGTFTGTKQKPELRVVLDERGRVSGFWCKPWHRTLR